MPPHTEVKKDPTTARPPHAHPRSTVALAAMLLLGMSSCSGGPATEPAPSLARFEFERMRMAMTWRIVLYADNRLDAETAAERVYDRLAALDARLSDWKPESELSRLGDAARHDAPVEVRVSSELATILNAARAYARASDGAFDPTIEPLVKLWRRARRRRVLPKATQLAAARARVDYRSFDVDTTERIVRITKAGLRFDLGGIAKGYALDASLETLRRHGITRALVDGGGDIACGDPPPGSRGWRIGVAPLERDAQPSRFLTLARCAVATSGDAFQFVEIAGKRYSHLVDPRTGLGLIGRSQVTVVAPRAIDADAIATACSVLGPSEGLAFVATRDRAAVRFVVERHPRGSDAGDSDAGESDAGDRAAGERAAREVVEYVSRNFPAPSDASPQVRRRDH